MSCWKRQLSSTDEVARWLAAQNFWPVLHPGRRTQCSQHYNPQFFFLFPTALGSISEAGRKAGGGCGVVCGKRQGGVAQEEGELQLVQSPCMILNTPMRSSFLKSFYWDCPLWCCWGSNGAKRSGFFQVWEKLGTWWLSLYLLVHFGLDQWQKLATERMTFVKHESLRAHLCWFMRVSKILCGTRGK